ncbi:MAG: preprotein translocase subunit YajC [Planctomycetes bacterium]|nr:preprotein translocase subunit YajC [Planctomycetota bacterium]
MFDIDLYVFTLAQEGGPEAISGEGLLPPPPGEGAPLTGAAGSQGAPARDSSLLGGNLIFVLGLVFVVMIAFSFLGQRRDRKKRQSMISAVKKHDVVQTVGGVIGSIVEVKADTVVLKVDESSNTRITFARSSIQQVLDDGPASKPSLEASAD